MRKWNGTISRPTLSIYHFIKSGWARNTFSCWVIEILHCAIFRDFFTLHVFKEITRRTTCARFWIRRRIITVGINTLSSCPNLVTIFTQLTFFALYFDFETKGWETVVFSDCKEIHTISAHSIAIISAAFGNSSCASIPFFDMRKNTLITYMSIWWIDSFTILRNASSRS